MIKILPQVDLPAARLLGGYASEVIGRELDRHGFTADEGRR